MKCKFENYKNRDKLGGWAMTQCLAHLNPTHLSPSQLWAGLGNDSFIASAHLVHPDPLLPQKRAQMAHLPPLDKTKEH